MSLTPGIYGSKKKKKGRKRRFIRDLEEGWGKGKKGR